ncbi:MAG: CPBP family intramembrane glutamic endopeptidase [Sporomusa sp.]
MLNKIRHPLRFAATMVPIAAIGGVFTIIHTMSNYEPTVRQELINASGSYMALLLLGTLQAVVFTAICGFLGYILSDKTGLMRPFKFEKKPLLSTAIATLISGILFSLDYWLFGQTIPGLSETYEIQTSPSSFVSSIFYGGVVEEVLMRLFLMSLFVFLLCKIFVRKYDREHTPQSVFIVANILAAALFAAGHLPATISTFGSLTPIIVFRCFLYNGGLGLVFGWLYHKYGIHYSMFAHAGVHIVSKIIWLLFI